MTTAKEAHLWRHEIQHGPEGEANYAWVYDGDGEMVCTAKTYHAEAIVTHMNALTSLQGEDAVERVARMIDPHAHAAYAEAFSRNDFAEQMTWINAVNQSRAKARDILAKTGGA